MKKIMSFILMFSLLLSTFSFAETVEDLPSAEIETMTRKFYIMEGTEKKYVDEVYLDSVHFENDIFVEYTVEFDDIPKSSFLEEPKDKEVVLVLDNSTSMNYILSSNRYAQSYETSRMDIVQEAANSFVESLAENSKMKLALLYYDDYSDRYIKNNSSMLDISQGYLDDGNGNNSSSNTAQKNNVDDIKYRINHLANHRGDYGTYSMSGGTNIGDALRDSMNLVASNESSPNAEKYLVFLTDGEPSVYSWMTYDEKILGLDDKFIINEGDNRGGKYYNYFYTGTQNHISELNGANGSTTAANYAQYMGELLTGYDNTYFLSFNTSSKSKLQDVADTISDDIMTLYYPRVDSAQKINEIYDSIANQITASFTLDNAILTDEIPEGLSLIVSDDHPQKNKITTRDRKFTYNIGSVNFNLVNDYYVAEPVTLDLKLAYTTVGEYNFPLEKGMFYYSDFDQTGDDKTYHNFQANGFKVALDPVKNVKAVRPHKEGENPENKVVVTWDSYEGAIGYNVYKLHGDEEIKLNKDSLSTDKTSTIIPIDGEDGPSTTYKIEAILPNDNISGKGTATINTVPSIENLKVERENNEFIVSWDKIDDSLDDSVATEDVKLAEVYYSLLPIISGPSSVGKEQPTIIQEDKDNDDLFTIVNKRVYYKFKLTNSEQYDNYSDTIKFVVDANKTYVLNRDVMDANGAVSDDYRIKQVVTTQILSNIDEESTGYKYSKNKEVLIEVKSDETKFPNGVFLYNPVITLNLELPIREGASNFVAPLVYSYPTVKLYRQKDDAEEVDLLKVTILDNGNKAETINYEVLDRDYEPLAITTKAIVDNGISLKIKINEYDDTFMKEDTKLIVVLESSLSFKSNNGQLDSNVFDNLKDLKNELDEKNKDDESFEKGLTVYQIPDFFDVLFKASYDTEEEQDAVRVKAYFSYNLTNKLDNDFNVPDTDVGISTKKIMVDKRDKIGSDF